MENAPSHSGVLLNAPLERSVSRVRGLVGTNCLVTCQGRISWVLVWLCESGSAVCGGIAVGQLAPLQRLGPGGVVFAVSSPGKGRSTVSTININ